MARNGLFFGDLRGEIGHYGMMLTTDSMRGESNSEAYTVLRGSNDKVWMPTYSDLSSGRIVSGDEIVLEPHAVDLDIDVGDEIEISAGYGKFTYEVVGIGFHPMHLYFATEGSTLPADDGTFATGYLTDTGLEKLANLSAGSSNLILIDVAGTPNYDLQSTSDVDENPEMTKLVKDLSELMSNIDDSPVMSMTGQACSN